MLVFQFSSLKKYFIFFCLLVPGFISFLHSDSSAQIPDVHNFVGQIKSSLESKDISAYLLYFSENVRSLENDRINSIFSDFKMDSAQAYIASIQDINLDQPIVYLRVFFQNSYSVIMQLWRFNLILQEGLWMVDRKDSIGETKQLYKLKLPSARVERVQSLEIHHTDIHISFTDALLFYDNIPDFETAILVVGKGNLDFSPSHPREQHQLDLVFKKKRLQDKLSYGYFRFSNSFFSNNVKIVKTPGRVTPATESERKKAYSLFSKHYYRSFTVRNSLNGELLSILPQGDDAVFEFAGKKTGTMTYVNSPNAEDEINLYQWKEDRILNLYSPPLGEGKKRLFISTGRQFDIEHYDLEIEYKPSDHSMAGKARINVRTQVGMLDGLRFKMNPAFEILRINDSNKRELYFTQDKLRQVIYIYFLKPPSRGQVSSIEVFYRGKIPPSPARSDMVLPIQTEQTIRFYQPQYETYLYTRSALWYPVSSEVDYFTARLKIILPPGYKVVSNGKLTEQFLLEGLENINDVGKMGNSVYVFEALNPLKYLSFLVGKLDLVQETSGPVPIKYFRSSYTRPDHWDLFSGARDIVRFFENVFGPFPFEKLNIIKRAWVTSGGNSPASFIIINELSRMASRNLRHSSDSPVDLSRWREYFLAHEIAHQWWGQGIAWASYQDNWISEGMAQFAAVLFLREKYGDRAFVRIMDKFSRDIEKKSIWGAITMGSRISHFNFLAYQTIVYNKATMVLFMLQDLLGEELFNIGIERFFSMNKYGSASTQEFFNVFHDISGMNLKRFFDKWFNSYLLPEVETDYKVNETAGKYSLQFTFRQKSEIFVFPLWVEWKENGRTMRRKIIIDDRIISKEFFPEAKPGKIKINPIKTVPGKFLSR